MSNKHGGTCSRDHGGTLLKNDSFSGSLVKAGFPAGDSDASAQTRFWAMMAKLPTPSYAFIGINDYGLSAK